MGTIIPVQWYKTEANKNIHLFMKIFAFLHYGIYLFIYLFITTSLPQGLIIQVFNSG